MARPGRGVPAVCGLRTFTGTTGNMYVKQLEWHHFRSLTSGKLAFTQPMVLVTGDNAQGKTNLLEAVYFALNGISFRGAKNEHMLQQGQRALYVKAAIRAKAGCRHSVVSYSKGKKRALIDDRLVPTISRFRASFSCLAFSYHQLQQFLRAPAWRRRILDTLVLALAPDCFADMARYRHVVKSRNRLLQGPCCSHDMLAVYTRDLVRLAARITSKRLAFLADCQQALEDLLDAFPVLQGLQARLLLRNRPADNCFDTLVDCFTRISQRALPKDRALGFTTWGTAYQDFSFFLANRPLLGYASRGQTKLSIILLTLAAATLLYKKNGEYPVLICDDLASEMSPQNTAALVSLLAKRPQVFIADLSQTLCPPQSMIVRMCNGNPCIERK